MFDVVYAPICTLAELRNDIECLIKPTAFNERPNLLRTFGDLELSGCRGCVHRHLHLLLHVLKTSELVRLLLEKRCVVHELNHLHAR